MSAIVSVIAPPGFLPHFILVLYIPSVCISLLISSLFLDYQSLSFSLLIISLSLSLPHPSISLVYSSVCLIYHSIGLVYPFKSRPLSLHATCPLLGHCPHPPSSPVPSWRLPCLCPLARDLHPYLGHSLAVYAGPYGSTPLADVLQLCPPRCTTPSIATRLDPRFARAPALMKSCSRRGRRRGSRPGGPVNPEG